jgi:CcmD family protein
VLLPCLIALALLSTAPAELRAAATQPPPKPAQDEFVPLDSLEAQEQLPATPLVTIAYAAAWLVIFGYLWSLWRRLARVERELAEVTRRVTPRGASDTDPGGHRSR